MKNTKAALIWITNILKKHYIPFQISGGLAAIVYGVTRPLADIDIDIPDDKFDSILEEVISTFFQDVLLKFYVLKIIYLLLKIRFKQKNCL